MYSFKILDPEYILEIVPLVYELNGKKIEIALLEQRFKAMVRENYECAVIINDQDIIGVTGLWYCTRHYAGKSVELDHVFIKPEHRSKGLGTNFMQWIKEYLETKGAESMELNTYVQNYPSHKFYYNEGMEIWGYHFFKRL